MTTRKARRALGTLLGGMRDRSDPVIQNTLAAGRKPAYSGVQTLITTGSDGCDESSLSERPADSTVAAVEDRRRLYRPRLKSVMIRPQSKNNDLSATYRATTKSDTLPATNSIKKKSVLIREIRVPFAMCDDFASSWLQRCDGPMELTAKC